MPNNLILHPILLAKSLSKIYICPFYLSVVNGLFFGFLLLIDGLPAELILTEGPYSLLLWINAWGLLSCTLLFLIPIGIQKVFNGSATEALPAENA